MACSNVDGPSRRARDILPKKVPLNCSRLIHKREIKGSASDCIIRSEYIIFEDSIDLIENQPTTICIRRIVHKAAHLNDGCAILSVDSATRRFCMIRYEFALIDCGLHIAGGIKRPTVVGSVFYK